MNKKLLSEIKDKFSCLELDSPFATTEMGESNFDIKSYFFRIFYPYGISEVKIGASKVVLFFKKAGFVIKIPFEGYYSYDKWDDTAEQDENDYTTWSFYEYTSVQNGNYIEEEIRLYDDTIKKAGFSHLFAKNKFLCECANGIPIYYQEEMICADDMDYHEISKKDTRRLDSIFKRKSSWNSYLNYLPKTFILETIKLFGEDYTIRFCNFLDNNIDDLRSANVGFRKNGMPVVLDYAGFYD